MSAQPDQNGSPLTRAERKQLLALACAADRSAWQHACRPVATQPGEMAGRLLSMAEPFVALLPARVGRWLRGAKFFTNIGRQLGFLGG
jgi:hypothetical protein